VTDESWPRIQELFEEALARPREERTAFLAEACEGAEGLSERVQTLLRAHEEAGTFLERPLFGAGDSAAEPSPEPADSLAGRTVGHYRIRSLIARGGMGQVFLAEQEKPHRTVALKLIRPELLSSETLRRFEREAEVLGRLQHPGIAQIFEAGAADLGRGPQPFLAMEFVEGRSLTAFAAARGLGTRDRLSLLVQVCRAVEHAHRKGVIHCDLKPANVLVDDSGQAKVLDFGVARAMDSDARGTTLRTDLGRLIGTIPYMSPEQVTGDHGSLDPRSDVYALGVLGYELLTGRLPYDVSRKPLPEIIRVITERDPAPLSTGDRALRGDLETIFLKALEKDRHRRYPSAADLADDIGRYVRHEPIAARPPTTAYHLGKLIRRHRLPFALAAGAFLLVCALAIAAATQAARAVRARDRAERVNAYLQGMLASFTPAEARGTTVPLRQVLDEAARRVTSELEADPEIAAALEETIGNGYRGLGLYDQAESHLTRSLALRETLPGSEAAAVADSLHSLAVLHTARSDYEAAEPLYRRALGIRRGPPVTDELDVADTLEDLAFLLRERGAFDEAEPLLIEGLEIRRRRLGEAHPDTASALAALGSLYKDRGEFERAEPLYRQALQTRRRPADGDLGVASNLNLLASLLQEQGDLESAEPLYQEAWAIRRKVLGDDHAEAIASFNNLAVLRLERGDHAAAEPMLREAITRRRALVGERPYLAGSLNSLAILLLQRGALDEAEALARESLSIRRRLTASHPDLARTLDTLGLIQIARGDLPAAEPLLREALALRRENLSAGSDLIADSLVSLGSLLTVSGRSEEAEPLLREALAIRARTRPRAPWCAAEVESHLGACLTEAQRYEDAEPLLLRGWESLKAHWGDTDHRTRAAAGRLARLHAVRDRSDVAARHDPGTR
jgi:serine/threonine protein kinase/Flp pilus assembly protein TadD